MNGNVDCTKLVRMANGKIEINNSYFYESPVWADAIDKCDSLLDKKAFNVIIYDAYSQSGDRSARSGRGNTNKAHGWQPYILLDYERVFDDYNGLNVQNPITHEAGHAFGVQHICDLNAKDNNSDTNIMASGNTIKAHSHHGVFEGELKYDCPDNGGNRSRGFTAAQLIRILEVSYQHAQSWLE